MQKNISNKYRVIIKSNDRNIYIYNSAIFKSLNVTNFNKVIVTSRRSFFFIFLKE